MRPAVLHDSDVVHLTPLVPAIRDAAEHSIGHEDPCRVAALVLRESGAGYAPGYAPQGDPCGWGDHGHAFGLCQIDKRFHAHFIRLAAAKTVRGQLDYATSLLHFNRHWLSQSLKDHALLERATYAAYNANIRHVLDACRMSEPDPDSVTTGGDYSDWVFKVADQLRSRVPDLRGVASSQG